MSWHDNDAYHRSVNDDGYVITWADNAHGRWCNAWARRQEGQRRGKHLGAGYDRRELERICDEHKAKQVSRGTLEEA